MAASTTKFAGSALESGKYQILCKTELPIPLCTIEFPLVTRCPNGVAYGAFDLRNRGLDLVQEITCWPRGKHYALTTGREKEVIGSEFKIKLHYNPLSPIQRRMCEILQLEHWELATFLKSWNPQVKTLSSLHKRLRLDDKTGEIIDASQKGWDCKRCGHMWTAKKRVKLCPHCESAWWERKPSLADLSESEMALALEDGL